MTSHTKSKLMKASDWADREFTENSAPQNRTIKSWVLKGKILGRIIDGRVYVYDDQHFGLSPVVSSAINDLIAASR